MSPQVAQASVSLVWYLKEFTAGGSKAGDQLLLGVLPALEALARRYDMVPPSASAIDSGYLLWCTGLTGDRFRTDSSISRVDKWVGDGSDATRCYDLHVWVDSDQCQIAVRFEDIGLLEAAADKSSGNKQLKLAEDFEQSIPLVMDMIDRLLEQILVRH